MIYKITFKMAVDLIQTYLERIYALDRHKGTSVVKVQRLYELNYELKGLAQQLHEQGHNVGEIIRGIKEALEKKYQYDKIDIFVDGAARGNDNPDKANVSGIGYAIYGDSQLLYQNAIYLGSKKQLPRLRNEPADIITEIVDITNNVAEYLALIEALEFVLQIGMNANHIEIFSDSTLVVNQVNMLNSTKAPHLIVLRNCAQELMDEFDNITISYIPREQNEYVDQLVNKVLDEHIQAVDV